MMQMFAHNSMKMKEKGLLVYKKIGGNRNDFPLSEPTGSSIEHLNEILKLYEKLLKNAVL